jgi:hypothetical protein
MPTKILLIYEVAQIDEVVEYLGLAAELPCVVALDFWVECELRRRGIECASFSAWRLSDDERDLWFAKASDIAREWYRLPELSFFSHRGLLLGEALEPAVEALETLFYYFVPLRRMFAAHENLSSVIVPHRHGRIPVSAGPSTQFEFTAVIDVVHFLARDGGFFVQELGTRPEGAVAPFPRQRLSVKALLLWNFFIRSFVRSKPIKVFASENWYHISPFLERMDDVELVLMERSEINHISWRQLWAHRIRFIHPLGMQSRALRSIAYAKQAEFKKAWPAARKAVASLPHVMHEGTSIWPLVGPALDFLVERYAERVVYDAEAFAAIYRKEGIQKVVLRASVSGHNPHFFIAAKIAASMSIPSIELQHAGAVLDPRSVHSRMEASYLAGYGTLTRNIYCRNHGYAPQRIRPVGSPRFDSYMKKLSLTEEERASRVREIGLDPARPVVLVATPADIPGLMPHVFDSYENANLFAVVANLQKLLPDLQVLFKFRGGGCSQLHKEYIDEVFGGKNYSIVDDDLFSRVQMCDLAFSNNSTAFYEVMMGRKPLVLFPWRKTDTYASRVYQQAAPIVFNRDELAPIVEHILNDLGYRRELISTSAAFLKDHYAFDGRASQRMTEILRQPLPAL